ncbi:hypothetical protein [Burkholderia metallica]|uniref:hypothetical protein n=1 Tax=Burkholderia metallica TaxID=488729 RepID=UPI001CF259B2|nr:hypothetical protein [Burkholderia metallica]MCA8002386.1 hypothetical protein [Burkholderia metallica]
MPRKTVYGQMTMSDDLHARFIPNSKPPLERAARIGCLKPDEIAGDEAGIRTWMPEPLLPVG